MIIYVYDPSAEVAEVIKKKVDDNYQISKVLTNEETIGEELTGKVKIDVLIVNIKELKKIKGIIKDIVPYVIVISNDVSAAVFKRSLELGVKDFLTTPIKKNELNTALKKAGIYLTTVSSLGKMDAKSHKKQAKIVSLISSKGGMGKSLIAANLGVLLQKEFKRKVLIIDSVPQFGSIDILLDINEKKSIEMIPSEIENYDAYWEEIDDNIVTHTSGVDVLVAGGKTAEQIPVHKLKTILTAVKEKYDYVLIDTQNYFVELNLALLELSDQVLFISAFDIAAIKNLSSGLRTIKSLYYSIEKIKIIINRYDKSNDLTIAEMEKYLNNKVSLLIPEDHTAITNSINQGVPFVLEPNNSEITNTLRDLGNIVLGRPIQEKLTVPIGAADNKNWFKNFFGV